jgi:hypothetical protein
MYVGQKDVLGLKKRFVYCISLLIFTICFLQSVIKNLENFYLIIPAGIFQKCQKLNQLTV